MNKKKNCTNKGITLIALIITVIVLLILAGTAISIAINGGDIFSKAADARNQWNTAVATEQEKVDEVWNILNTMTGETAPTLPAAWGATAATYVAEAYTDGTEDTRQVPIPKGFVVSSYQGSGANHEGREDQIATGLVIYKGTTPVDANNHDEALTTRDQYVWIPVDNSSTITWTNEGDDTIKLTSTDTSEVDLTKEDALTLDTDFAAMKTSVQTYGGFYISRYELGCILNQAGTEVAEANTSRKGQVVYNAYNSGIDQNGACWGVNSWYGLYDVAHQDISDGTNTVLKGHMIFGNEYEKVLSFIDSNNGSYSSTIHQNKQETKPHKSGNVTQSGKELDIVKNIVDLEGNLLEWTAKAYNNSRRVHRGGYYNGVNYGGYIPASGSSGYYPIFASSAYGVRQSLYVVL